MSIAAETVGRTQRIAEHGSIMGRAKRRVKFIDKMSLKPIAHRKAIASAIKEGLRQDSDLPERLDAALSRAMRQVFHDGNIKHASRLAQKLIDTVARYDDDYEPDIASRVLANALAQLQGGKREVVADIAFGLGFWLGRLVERQAWNDTYLNSEMRRLKDRLKGLATGAKHRERISESQQVEKQFWLERYREHRKVTRADEETAAEFRVSDRTIANRRRLRNWAQEAG